MAGRHFVQDECPGANDAIPHPFGRSGVMAPGGQSQSGVDAGGPNGSKVKDPPLGEGAGCQTDMFARYRFCTQCHLQGFSCFALSSKKHRQVPQSLRYERVARPELIFPN